MKKKKKMVFFKMCLCELKGKKEKKKKKIERSFIQHVFIKILETPPGFKMTGQGITASEGGTAVIAPERMIIRQMCGFMSFQVLFAKECFPTNRTGEIAFSRSMKLGMIP